MPTYKTGDIFTTEALAIGHGINTQGLMGAGIAVQFRDRFPEMYEHYANECAQSNLFPGDIMPYEVKEGRWVYNMASQELPGKNASYEWLYTSAVKALNHAHSVGIDTIAIPRIGCGIGGLSWGLVNQFLTFAESRSTGDTTFEVWTL